MIIFTFKVPRKSIFWARRKTKMPSCIFFTSIKRESGSLGGTSISDISFLTPLLTKFVGAAKNSSAQVPLVLHLLLQLLIYIKVAYITCIAVFLVISIGAPCCEESCLIDTYSYLCVEKNKNVRWTSDII